MCMRERAKKRFLGGRRFQTPTAAATKAAHTSTTKRKGVLTQKKTLRKRLIIPLAYVHIPYKDIAPKSLLNFETVTTPKL
jgi:hypothetical protein